jgi:hypothetical protein
VLAGAWRGNVLGSFRLLATIALTGIIVGIYQLGLNPNRLFAALQRFRQLLGMLETRKYSVRVLCAQWCFIRAGDQADGAFFSRALSVALGSTLLEVSGG